eukprot:Gb_07695 [translate_table: standard]
MAATPSERYLSCLQVISLLPDQPGLPLFNHCSSTFQLLSSSNGPEGGRPSIFTSNFFKILTLGGLFNSLQPLCPDLLCESFQWLSFFIRGPHAPSATNLLQTCYNAKPISGFHRHSSNITLQPSRSSSGSENKFTLYETAANYNATAGSDRYKHSQQLQEAPMHKPVN